MHKKQRNFQKILANLLFLIIFSLAGCAGSNTGEASPVPTWPAITPASPLATQPASGNSPHTLSQGLYESCSPSKGEICLNRLEQMAAAGFTVVINYNQLDATAAQELAYAQKAHELGMKIIWDMDDPVFRNAGNILRQYQTLAATCNCSDDAGFIRYYVNLVKNLPATWGYYIGDEVQSSDQPRLKAFSDYVRGLDPSHPRLIVQGAISAQSAQDNLTPFVSSADVLGVDFYPVGADDMSIGDTGAIAHTVQTIADQHNKQAAMVLQAFSWSQYPASSGVCSPYPSCAPFPTEEQMSQMFNATIQNSTPTLILWYSYYNVIQSNNPRQNWNNLIQAAGL